MFLFVYIFLFAFCWNLCFRILMWMCELFTLVNGITWWILPTWLKPMWSTRVTHKGTTTSPNCDGVLCWCVVSFCFFSHSFTNSFGLRSVRRIHVSKSTAKFNWCCDLISSCAARLFQVTFHSFIQSSSFGNQALKCEGGLHCSSSEKGEVIWFDSIWFDLIVPLCFLCCCCCVRWGSLHSSPSNPKRGKLFAISPILSKKHLWKSISNLQVSQ